MLKQIIKDKKFKNMLYMTKDNNSTKIGIIKTYAKRREQYNALNKEDDEAMF